MQNSLHAVYHHTSEWRTERTFEDLKDALHFSLRYRMNSCKSILCGLFERIGASMQRQQVRAKGVTWIVNLSAQQRGYGTLDTLTKCGQLNLCKATGNQISNNCFPPHDGKFTTSMVLNDATLSASRLGD